MSREQFGTTETTGHGIAARLEAAFPAPSRRRFVASTLGVLFPTEIDPDSEGFRAVESHLERNEGGVLFVYNHPGKMDPHMIYGAMNSNSQVASERNWLSPISAHHPGLTLPQWFFAARTCLVETPHTRERSKGHFQQWRKAWVWTIKKVTKVELLNADEFRQETADFLMDEKGLTGVAINKGRSPVLLEPSHVVENIIAKIPESQRKGILTVPVGIEYDGVQDYSRINRLRWPRTYTVTLGEGTTADELHRQATLGKNEDALLYERLRKLVPDTYKPKTRK